jgi:hypothetical protein
MIQNLPVLRIYLNDGQRNLLKEETQRLKE